MNFHRLVAYSLLPLALAIEPSWSTAQAPAPASAQASAVRASFSPQELEALLAPIALYPDALLVQVLMASTYPLEVVQAERWVKAHPGLQGKALEDALQSLPWDPAVKSLAAFPQVLQMMSDQIDWTQKLGDAFLAQEKEVLAAAQRLRKRAMDQGQLASTAEQQVRTESAAGETVVRIEPSNPQVVYVPTYNPTTVYGGWPYPAYPPYAYYPPGYTAGAMFFGFAAGAIVGSALWGDCDWHGGSVNINTQRYNSFNRSNVQNRSWSHNAAHRGAVPYRSQQVAQRYGRAQPAGAAARDQRYRGRTDTALASPQGRNAGGVSARGNAAAGAERRGNGGLNAGMHNTSAFDTRRGAQTRDYSNRGASSLNSARASGNYGGARGAGGGGYSGGRGGGGGGGFGGGRGGGRR